MNKTTLISLGKIIFFITLFLLLSVLVVVTSPIKYYVYIATFLAIIINIILYKKMKDKFIEKRIIITVILIILFIVSCSFLYSKMFVFIVNRIEMECIITQEELINDSIKVTPAPLALTKGGGRSGVIYYNTGLSEEIYGENFGNIYTIGNNKYIIEGIFSLKPSLVSVASSDVVNSNSFAKATANY